jgi:hypothetical protein
MAIRAATADTGNPDISPFIVTWDDSTSTVNGHVLFRKSGTPATFAIFALGAITDNTAWLQIALTHVASNGSWSNADTAYISFIGRNGDKGDTGSTGAKGDAPGVLMAWETATGDSDQGAGKLWGSSGTISSISTLYVDDLEAGGASINSFVDTWDDSTNSNPKGHIYIVKNSAPENFHLFAVTSTVVSASTYSKVPVSFIQTSGTISDGDAVSMLFTRAGDKGADGSGSMSSFIMSDGSTTQTITDGQTQVFAAGEGINVAVSSTDTVTYSAEDASVTNKGVAEIATIAETVTGTDSGRVVTPAGLHGALAGLTDTTIVAADQIIFADTSDSNALKEDTVQGILDLAGGGGAWASITTTACTTVSEITFTGFAAGTYSNYQFWISNAMPTAGTDLKLQTSTDGGSSYDSGASDYEYNFQYIRTGSIDHGNDAADSEIHISGDQNVEQTGEGWISATIDLYFPEEAEYTNLGWRATFEGGGSDVISMHGSGVRKATADVDAVRFFWSSGTFVAKGQIQMLGMVN